ERFKGRGGWAGGRRETAAAGAAAALRGRAERAAPGPRPTAARDRKRGATGRGLPQEPAREHPAPPAEAALERGVGPAGDGQVDAAGERVECGPAGGGAEVEVACVIQAFGERDQARIPSCRDEPLEQVVARLLGHGHLIQ